MTIGSISGIELRNFRAFSEPVRIPLGKITLLFGQNSAGKSSIIKSLLLLQQTIRDENSRRRKAFVFSGDAVDLGSFATTVFGHDLDRDIGLGIDFDLPPERHPQEAPAEFLGRGGFTWTVKPDLFSHDTQVRFAGQPFDFSRIPYGSSHLYLLRQEHVETWCDFMSSGGNLFSTSDPVLVDLRSGQGLVPAFSGSLSPERFLGCASLSGRLDHRRRIPLKTYGDDDGDFDGEDQTVPTSRQSSVAASWINSVRPLERHLRITLRTLSHLGPLRREPQRLERYTPTADRNVGASGEDMLSLMFDRPSLVTEVNNYLGLMGLPYRVQVLPIGEQNAIGSMIYLSLTNLATGIELSPSDVGVGYSQVLPLIAQAVLSRDSLICVEQPELHLHPAMQARLGDLFIQQALSGNNVQFLIETHSESLMLRILRRIREGRLNPQEVKVLYVDQSKEGISEVVDLPILPSGDFAVPWPHGFFDERMEEYGF